MKHLKKIAIWWLVIQGIDFLALWLFPHRPVETASMWNRALQFALLLLSFYLVRKDPNRKNRYIFLNFIFVFSVSIFTYLYDFIGVSILTESRYAAHYLNQYSTIAFQLFLAFAILYILFDIAFHTLKTRYKYALTLAVTLFVSVFYFSDYVRDPLYLYSTNDIKQWKSLSQVVPYDAPLPSAVDLAGTVKLQEYENGQAVRTLTPEENLNRIDDLLPYLENDNWIILLFKPLYFNTIKVNVIVIGSIILFFLFQFRRDPPQGAYIDKIMFLMLLLSSMEILHNWGFISSVEVSSWSEIFNYSQYITVLMLFVTAVLFALRLRFVTSPQGEFYETELATNPQGVSRWIDRIDRLVLTRFSHNSLQGRLFQSPSAK